MKKSGKMYSMMKPCKPAFLWYRLRGLSFKEDNVLQELLFDALDRSTKLQKLQYAFVESQVLTRLIAR